MFEAPRHDVPNAARADAHALSVECSYNDVAKRGFHRVAAKYLQRLKRELSDIYGEGTLRHNQGGIAVSGEITLHLEHLYVQVSQPWGGNGNIVMFRRCEGPKDYTGGQNNFASTAWLVDPPAFARYIQERVTSTQKRGERAL
jgi:hypothetical protein